MTRNSTQQIIKKKNYCIHRDGINCLYCNQPNNDKCVLDHLDGNPKHDYLENYAVVHQACNIKKIQSIDYQIIAKEKKRDNELAPFIPIEDKTDTEATTEIKINKSNFDITKQLITEIIQTDNSMSWNDALYGSAMKCKELTGYGSVQCIRNYLKMLTSPCGKFMITQNESREKIIVKRVN